MFPVYCIGMAIAGMLSIPYRPALMLRIIYAAVIVTAHYTLALHSLLYGRDFYLWAGLFQYLVLIAALFAACSATLPMILLALAACLINTLAYYNFPSHEGVWTIYFRSINSIETAQICCLLFFSPISIRLIKRYTNLKNKGAQTWMLRRLFQEM